MSFLNRVCLQKANRLFGKEYISHAQSGVVIIQSFRIQRYVKYAYEYLSVDRRTAD